MDYYAEKNEWIVKGEEIAEKVCILAIVSLDYHHLNL